LDDVLDELLAGDTFSPEGDTFSPEAWRASRQRCLEILEQQLMAAATHDSSTSIASKTRLMIIMDDNNHYRSMRYSCFHLARRFRAAFLQIHLPCDVRTALERNAVRNLGSQIGRNVPDASIRRMADILEAPSDKIAWERPCLFLKSSSSKEHVVDDVWTWILQSWACYVTPPYLSPEEAASRRSLAQAETESSLVHQLDLRTRAMTTSALERVNQSSRAGCALSLNKLRRELLAAFRLTFQGSEETAITAMPSNNHSMMMDLLDNMVDRYTQEIQEVLRRFVFIEPLLLNSGIGMGSDEIS
jgi:tRNA uridine 5-carbamoylmethylation protein Kti12